MLNTESKQTEEQSCDKTLTYTNDLSDLNEPAIWRGYPSKTTIILQSFAGIWPALFFGAFAIFMLNFGVPLFGFPIILIAVSLGLVIVPPIWKISNLPKTEYIVTDKRLVIKTGITKENVWSAKLSTIKEVVVTRGIIDRLLGTGKLYPITAQYPYAPKLYAYSKGGMYSTKKVFNLITGTYDEVTQSDLYAKSMSHPHLEGIVEPFKAQKLLKENIGSSCIDARVFGVLIIWNFPRN